MMWGGKGLIGVDRYKDIRYLATVEGLSQRAIAKRLGISRNTVKRYVMGQNVPWERARTQVQRKVITPEVLEFINHCLEEDKTAPGKQIHTAKRIYDRLVGEQGFQGGESTVRGVVAQLRPNAPAVFVPLSFSPGEAAQVDWGTATVYIAGEKVRPALPQLCTLRNVFPSGT
jgi:transposase